MATQMASFRASIPKNGVVLEYFYQIPGGEEDFDEPKISDPEEAAQPGYVQFTITIPGKENGVTVNLVQALTLTGQLEDFDEPSIDGPVMVAQEPPFIKAP